MAHQPAVESMGIVGAMFNNIYRGRRVLVTGHTGFKGSWLALWLTRLGAQVSGIALPPATQPNHWDLLGLDSDVHCVDIRDAAALAQCIAALQPEIVFHLAAQPLVRVSYRDPSVTWATNVGGTVNLLEACRHTASVQAIVVVTTDKCYENLESAQGYRETDRLGGHDPYSASKAAAELAVASYRQSFFHTADGPLLASARAGNVIGGGDWSEDRLIPDLIRALTAGTALEIRSPHAVRPWQHVLDSLSGYLLLGQKLTERKHGFAAAWNFGPAQHDCATVADVLARMQRHWPPLQWQVSQQNQPHETQLLQLDSSKAHEQLGWQPVWPLDTALAATAHWYRTQIEQQRIDSVMQLDDYIAAARLAGNAWSLP
jgi:CDP-glucose 4,6-dehydratase